MLPVMRTPSEGNKALTLTLLVEYLSAKYNKFGRVYNGKCILNATNILNAVPADIKDDVLTVLRAYVSLNSAYGTQDQIDLWNKVWYENDGCITSIMEYENFI